MTKEQLMEEMLFEAVRQNNVKEVKGLLALGVDLNAKDSEKKTSLHWAAWKGHTELAKVLIDAGADLNANDEDEWTPLDLAYNQYGEDSDVYKMLDKVIQEHVDKLKAQIRKEIEALKVA